MFSRELSRCLLSLTAAVAIFAQTGAAAASDRDGTPSPPRKILLDTDPGGDDAFALLWLQSLAKQRLAEIVAVTTVAGNVRGELTFANAGKILALGGFGHVEVGRCVPRQKTEKDAAHIHGTDGMGNLAQMLPESRHRLSEARSAEDIIIEKLAAAPGEITLVAIGPLTNLAAAEGKRPGILAKAKEVVVMGGAFCRPGNVTPQAEFNISYDPEAAEKVFASRNDIVVLPLNVTQRITFTEELAESVRQAAPNSTIARFLVALCGFLTKTTLGYREAEGARGFHVHDAATLAYLFYPETLWLQRARVHVETQGQWTRGQTVIDQRHLAKPEPNAWLALQVDTVNLLGSMAEDLKVLCQSK
jgi:inosine-uridine nucleoside N-ribohydrolase